MTANLLTKGTQTRDATKIAQEVESLGASLDSGARWDSSFASVSGMSSKIPQAMESLADVVRRPTFKSEEVERLRQQYLDNVTLALGEAAVLIGDVARVNTDLERLQAVTAADIQRVMKKYFADTNRLVLYYLPEASKKSGEGK